MSRREEILAHIESVPAMPAAAAEVTRLVQDPDVEISDLTRAIEHDPGLASNVLRLANSASFGGRGTTSSVRDAIVRLGMKRIFQLVLASAVSGFAQRPVNGYDLSAGQLWEQSMAVALASENLAEALGIEAPEHLFTAGLLHDLGKIVMGTFLEVDAGPIVDLAFSEGKSFEMAEKEVLGIDHAEVGAALLASWNLPPELVQAVRWHHQPDACEGDTLVVDLVHLADALIMASGIGLGLDGLNYRASRRASGRFHLRPLASEAVVCKTLSQLDELREFFALTSGR